MEHAYCLFRASGEGDGYTVFDLMGVYTNLDKCIDDCLVAPIGFYKKITPIHPDMKADNNYIVVTQRSLCGKYCDYCCFGGHVIEKVSLNCSKPTSA